MNSKNYFNPKALFLFMTFLSISLTAKVHANCFHAFYVLEKKETSIKASYGYYTSELQKSFSKNRSLSADVKLYLLKNKFPKLFSEEPNPIKRMGMILAYLDIRSNGSFKLGARFSRIEKIVAKNYRQGYFPSLSLSNKNGSKFPSFSFEWKPRQGFTIKRKWPLQDRKVKLGHAVSEDAKEFEKFIFDFAIALRELDMANQTSRFWRTTPSSFRKNIIDDAQKIDPEIYRLIQLLELNSETVLSNKHDFSRFAFWEYVMIPFGGNFRPQISAAGFERYMGRDEVSEEIFLRKVGARANTHYYGRNIYRALILTAIGTSGYFGVTTINKAKEEIPIEYKFGAEMVIPNFTKSSTGSFDDARTPLQVANDRAEIALRHIGSFHSRIESESDEAEINYLKGRIKELCSKYLASPVDQVNACINGEL